jgi:TolB-like protein
MKRLMVALMLVSGSVAYAAGQAKVAVLPFDAAGPADKGWIAKAVQKNLMAELSRVNSVQPVAGTVSAADQDAALKAATEAGADFVVFGTYQVVEADLRLTGQVVEVATKKSVAGLKSTGSLRDLFGLEDVIANQVKRALPQPAAEAKVEMLQQPKAAEQPPMLEPNGPIVMDPNERLRAVEQGLDWAIERLKYAPAYEYDRPYYYGSYFSGSYYPYYSYPIYYYPVFIPRHHHHHGNGNWGSGGWNGSWNGGNWSGNVSVGTSPFTGNRNVMGNYANFGRMVAQPVRR